MITNFGGDGRRDGRVSFVSGTRGGLTTVISDSDKGLSRFGDFRESLVTGGHESRW